MSKLANLSLIIRSAYLYVDHFFIFNYDGYLGVSGTKKTSIIYIGWPNQYFFIVHNHKLAVDIYQFTHNCIFIDTFIFSKSKKLNVVIYIFYVFQSFQDRVFTSTYSLVNVMDLNSHNCRILIVDLAFESWQRRHYDHNFKFFSIFMSPTYSLNEGFGDAIFDWNKKLILDVDKLLWMVNKLDISFQNGSFILSLTQTKAPHWCASQKLMLMFPFL